VADPVGALLQVATGTLVRVAGLSFLSGMAWAGAAAAGIYLGSTRFAPCLAPGRVWAEWRRKRLLWGGCLLLCAAGTYLSSDVICRAYAVHDLYWLARLPEIFRLAWLGGACGYLFFLLLAVTVPLLRQRRSRSRRAASPPPRAARP
jgi:hypothetical protein